MPVPLVLLSDISGGPFRNTYLGAACFNSHRIRSIVKEFDRKFPDLRKLKGKDLNVYQLKKIVRFLDKNEVRMRAVSIRGSGWEHYKNNYCDYAEYQEKIFGIYHFSLVSHTIVRNEGDCSVFICKDNFLSNPERVKKTVNILKKAHRYNFRISHGLVKEIPDLRFADYVASAYRKIGRSLNNFRYFRIIICPHYSLFEKIFEL